MPFSYIATKSEQHNPIWPIVRDDAPRELKMYAAYALHVGTLWQIGDKGLEEALDELRWTAVTHNLHGRYGFEIIEWIIGATFWELGDIDYGSIRPKEGAWPWEGWPSC